MFEGRAVLYRTIRTLARTIERERAGQMAGPQFDAWLDEHCYTGVDASTTVGARTSIVRFAHASRRGAPALRAPAKRTRNAERLSCLCPFGCSTSCGAFSASCARLPVWCSAPIAHVLRAVR
jgi:hypothetical protein